MSPTATGLIGGALGVLVGASLMTVRELGRQQKRHEAGQHTSREVTVNRRNFLKFASVGALAAGTTVSAPRWRRPENKPPIPGALGMLYDSTPLHRLRPVWRSVQRLNGNPANPAGEAAPVQQRQAEPHTNNIIQVWKSGTGEPSDQLVDGYAYIKKQCMHCVDPNCVSVSPGAGAYQTSQDRHRPLRPGRLHRLPLLHGGRPFDVPKYDYDNPFGAIHKCSPATRRGLSARAGQIARLRRGVPHRRRHLRHPRGADGRGQAPAAGDPQAANTPTRARPSAPTIPPARSAQLPAYVYGEKGRHPVLVLAGCPIPSSTCPICRSPPGRARAYPAHPLQGMVLPLVVLTGSVLIRRNAKQHGGERGDDASHG